MVPISNYDVYDLRMRKSLIDKAFFLDKVDADVFVDFGCADGALLGLMSSIFPEYTYIGYDNDPTMVKLAYSTMFHYARDRDLDFFIHFDWDRIVDRIAAEKVQGKKTCLILSSVIHEVYNYCTPEEVAQFWDRVTNTGFDFVVIRDMGKTWYDLSLAGRFGPDESFTTDMLLTDEKSSTYLVEKVRETCRGEIGLRERLDLFEKRWGSIDMQNNLVHFLMKYPYAENWERELNEDYFPVGTLEVAGKFDRDRWSSTFTEVFALPFNERRILKDFGFTWKHALKVSTHYKMIFERLR